MFAGGWLSGDAVASEVVAGRIVIDPFQRERLNPNSYNYTLGPKVLRLVSEEIDLLGEEQYEALSIGPDGLLLHPNECYLAHTRERFGSDLFAALITGRSSVGRKFVTNHITAGLIDVGFEGQITLEVTVQRPTRVYTDVPFGQVFWFSVHGIVSPLYGGKYQSQSGPTRSRLSVATERASGEVAGDGRDEAGPGGRGKTGHRT